MEAGMTHDRTKLQAAALYLRRCMRREMAARPDLLPVLAEALSVIEATLQPAPAVTVPGLVRAERRRFAPTQVLALPQFEPTRLHEGFAPTLAATQLVPLP